MEVLTTDALAEPQVRRWTREEYHRLGEQGWFVGQRVQLIAGEIIQMPPMGYPHAKCVDRVDRALRKIFEPNTWVRAQLPLALPDESELQPDVSVVAGSPDSYTDHPTTSLLVVEISDKTLRLDRQLAGVYAAAAIPEYWIVNIQGEGLEVHRRPMADAQEESGFRYTSLKTFGRTDRSRR